MDLGLILEHQGEWLMQGYGDAAAAADTHAAAVADARRGYALRGAKSQ